MYCLKCLYWHRSIIAHTHTKSKVVIKFQQNYKNPAQVCISFCLLTPFLFRVNSQKSVHRASRTRGSSKGQRCGRSCGRCQLAVPTLQAALCQRYKLGHLRRRIQNISHLLSYLYLLTIAFKIPHHVAIIPARARSDSRGYAGTAPFFDAVMSYGHPSI